LAFFPQNDISDVLKSFINSHSPVNNDIPCRRHKLVWLPGAWQSVEICLHLYARSYAMRKKYGAFSCCVLLPFHHDSLNTPV